MYGAAPKQGVLGGLNKPSPSVAAFAKAKQMEAAAGLGMDREQKAQERGLQQMQDDSSLRQRENQNSAQRASNDIEARVQQGSLDSRRNVFNASQNYDYAALQKRQQVQMKQALLNNLARSF